MPAPRLTETAVLSLATHTSMTVSACPVHAATRAPLQERDGDTDTDTDRDRDRDTKQ
jgi:hypothetical protein